ncbi:MAG: ROK family protein [Muribaculaceae bacterium]|nr:ROK family protein [Muribaculaceae bacterium]
MAVIALDIGGTKVEGAVVAPDGSIMVSLRTLHGDRVGLAVGEEAAEMVGSLLVQAKALDVDITAVGVCVPGIVNREAGSVWAPNIPGWECFPLRDVLLRVLPHDVPVFIDSDRSCCIYGETWLGAAAGVQNAVFVAVGTGIGLGIKIDGHVLHGFGDIVGAGGWLALKPPYHNKYDACGCLEYYASGNGIGARARDLLAQGHTGCMLPGAKSVDEITSHDVFAAYDADDDVARAVLHRAVELWGMLAANLVSLLNPEVIVWGGGVFGPATRFIDDIRTEAAKWAQPVAMEQVRLIASRTTHNAILSGAAYIALNHNSL